MTSTHQANRRIHAALADVYDTSEPHFRPENQRKVKSRLVEIRRSSPGGRLLDIGCGTGFLLRLAADVFDDMVGLDITPEMLARAAAAAPSAELVLGSAEEIPFPDASFDAVSAYSFLDHLADVPAVFRQMRRVLRPGGRAYIDLVPNRMYWRALSAVPASDPLSDIVAREHRMVTANAQDVAARYGVDADDFVAAEPGKRDGGMDHEEVAGWAADAGFASCRVEFDWFLGQGAVLHGQGEADAAVVDAYLRRAFPLTRHLFKYFWVVMEA
jgi:ubiquinone/menaquinone biosynthesis C-methylase UbiE